MQFSTLLFDGWQSVSYAVIVGGLAYLGFVILLRLFGKGMLLKSSPSASVMTASLGGGLATIALLQTVGLTEGLVGFFILMVLQTTLVWFASRSRLLRQFVRPRPTLLFFEGQFLEAEMRSHGVAKADIYAAISRQGVVEDTEVGAVVFEIDGSLSVIRYPESGSYTTLGGVENYVPSPATYST